MECDLVQYEKKVETIAKIHSHNLLGENNLEYFQKPSQNDHLQIILACIWMPIWRSMTKVWSFDMVFSLEKII